MTQLLLILVLTLAIFNTCSSLPNKKQRFSQDGSWHEDGKYKNNYNFEEQTQINCDQQLHQHQLQHHDNNEFKGHLNPQLYASYNSLYNRLHPIPQDVHHRPEHHPHNDHSNSLNNYRKRIDTYADATEEVEYLTKKVSFETRTILDAPRNCKQYNFKGKCIRY